jgi:carbamoyl-phosphate synthase large subunit
MVSEYLPGRNLACCLLFYHGEIVKAICAERISYFMSHLVPSGVTGNTSEGRVFFSNELVATAESAVRLVAEKTGETMNGIVTVDLKEADSGDPLVTEVNLRHVAFTSAFTQAGANMAEAHLLATLGMVEAIDKEPPQINSKNRFFRDIDGLPVFVNQFVVTPVGECSPAKIETSAL